jgi:hypothetical protein
MLLLARRFTPGARDVTADIAFMQTLWKQLQAF